jgi:hypothetical protein
MGDPMGPAPTPATLSPARLAGFQGHSSPMSALGSGSWRDVWSVFDLNNCPTILGSGFVHQKPYCLGMLMKNFLSNQA